MSRSFFSILCRAIPPVCAVLFTVAFAVDTAAQQPTTDGQESNDSARFSKMEKFEQYVSYWTTEPGWRTELQLRNNLDPGELTVTPALRTADRPSCSVRHGDGAHGWSTHCIPSRRVLPQCVPDQGQPRGHLVAAACISD